MFHVRIKKHYYEVVMPANIPYHRIEKNSIEFLDREGNNDRQ